MKNFLIGTQSVYLLTADDRKELSHLDDNDLKQVGDFFISGVQSVGDLFKCFKLNIQEFDVPPQWWIDYQRDERKINIDQHEWRWVYGDEGIPHGGAPWKWTYLWPYLLKKLLEAAITMTPETIGGGKYHRYNLEPIPYDVVHQVCDLCYSTAGNRTLWLP